MNDLPRQTLCDLIATYGQALCDDPRRCEGLLRDFCSDHRREVFVLVSALKERVAADLLASRDGVPREVLLTRLSRRLYENLALAEDASRWAVESWAVALGLLPTAAAVHGSPSTGPNGAAGPIVVSQLGGGHYRTLAAAVRAAPPGARLLVRPGLYIEGIVLDRPLEIVGDGSGEEVVVESADAPCLAMQADHAVVRGLVLRGRAGARDKSHPAVDIARGQLVLHDCDITSDSVACVAIHGPAANPLIRRCQIHDGQQAGILVWDHAQGTVEDCTIFGHAGPAVEITQGASPVIRRCQIRDGQQTGMLVSDGGEGTVEDCDIFGHRQAGVAITTGAAPLVRRCQIHDGQESGVAVSDHGQGTVDDCAIFRNVLAGVEVKEGGGAVFRRCQIYDGRRGGVLVHQQGEGIVQECAIFGNALAGVTIASAGNPAVERCRIHGGKDAGVVVYQQGAGTVDGCDIFGNVGVGIAISEGGRPVVRGCRINQNGDVAVWVYEHGGGRVEDCDLTGNAGGAWDVEAGCRVERSRNKEL